MMEAVKTSTVKSKKPKTSRVKKAKENRNLKQKKKKKTLFAAVTTLGLKSAKVIHLKEIYAAGSDGKYNIRATSKILKSSANGHKKILVIREDGLEKQVHIHGTSHDVQALQDAFISKTGENEERLNIGMKSLEELTEKIDNTVETNPETNDPNAADTTLGEQSNRASDVGEDISTERKFPGVIIEEIVDVPGFFPDNLPSNNEEPVDFISLMVQEGTLSRKIEDEESEESLNKELEAFAAYTQAMHSSPQSQEMDTFSKVNEILESSAGELNGLRNPEAEDANHETEEESQYPETKPILGIDGIPGSSTIAMNGLGTPDADKEEEETKYQGKPRIIENKKIESDNEEYATILQTLQTAKRMASSRQNFQKKTKENDENGNKVTPNPSANQFSSFQQSSGLNCTVVLKHEYQPHEPVTPFKESQYIEETADLKSDYSDNAPKLQNTLSPTSNSQFDPQDGATASDVMKMVVDEENEKKIQRHHINAPPLNVNYSDVGTQTQPDDINDDSMDASSSSPTRKYRRNSLLKNNHISSHESSSSERSDTSSSDESNESEITDSEKIARLIKLNDSLLEHNSELIEQNTRLMTVFSSLKKPTGKAKDGKQSSSPDVQKQRKLVKKPEDLDDETMEILLNKSSMYLRTLHLVRLFWTEEELPHLYIKFPDPKKDTDVLVSNEEVTAIKKILQKVTEQKNIEKHTIENGWRDKVRASIGRQLSILRYHEKKKLESKDE